MKFDFGIICALKDEASNIINQLNDCEKNTICGIDYFIGTISNKKVVVCICGMGKVAAAICAQTMVLKYDPKVIINTGVGGSLTNELSVYDVAISSLFVQHDVDSSPLGDPKGFISGINIIYIPGSDNLRNKVKSIADSLNINNKTGIIATGDVFVDGKENKHKLHKEFGAIACDMESGAIAQVCYNSKTEYCAIRCISDNLEGDSSVDYVTFIKRAVEIGSKLTIEFIRQVNV